MRARTAHDELGVTAVLLCNADVKEKNEVIRLYQEAPSTLERNGPSGLATCQHLAVLRNRPLWQAEDFEEAALVRVAVTNDPGREYADQRVANIHGCL
jgi:hypothetical protein